MRVLLVKLSSIGDVLHAYPAVAEALRNRPDITIDWCVDDRFASLVRILPGIGRVIENDAYGKLDGFLKPEKWRNAWRLARRLKDGHYDLVIDAQGLIRSALVARGAKAPVAGPARADAREPIATWFYDRQIPVPRQQNAALGIRKLVAAALGYDFDPAWQPILPARGQVDPHQAFILPGASVEGKRWPVENWIELARLLQQRGYRISTTYWSAEERRDVNELTAAVPGIEVFAGRPIDEVAMAVGRAGLVVGNDSGLTHFADIAGCATVMQFSASDPRMTGPNGVRSRAVYRDQPPDKPLRRHLNDVVPPERMASVEQVLRAIEEVTG
jgi:heptosyltransferase I